MTIIIRNIQPSDYKVIISVIDEWWHGRKMRDMLPKLFFIHFQETSFIVEKENKIIGFLIGFLSQTHSEEAYIHFSGIDPNFRQQGLGNSLYHKFFQVVQKYDRKRVKCVTSPLNKNSIAFHLRLGFEIEKGNATEKDISYHLNYDGDGEHRVLFIKQL
ncbi:GNAT family N-acetyltransferase [Geminocystis sp. NIES-3709]|uniref:GNAT family N-acetyltransferase n=1 Tax=Geminocystis sp. NIES-3709 TaxID=1617448 RepID=UPI0005FC93DA|nr:GNAT family N-acetyltransferase [Geminocystis sp. NIES-3709]BAQ63608.1 acetyltransferase [Geminocystis sp. NIES-3709]